MSDNTEFETKLAVWTRIEKGNASKQDLELAQKWSCEMEENSFAQAKLHEQWLMRNGEKCLVCWSDETFTPNRSSISAELILFFAASYSMTDIENGGFVQYFWNNTGCMGPEAAIGFSRMNCNALAERLLIVMSMFGDNYPRLRADRHKRLAESEFCEKLNEQTSIFYTACEGFRDLSEIYFNSLSRTDLNDEEAN